MLYKDTRIIKSRYKRWLLNTFSVPLTASPSRSDGYINAKLAFRQNVVRNFVARHAGHRTNDAQQCIHRKMIPLINNHWALVWWKGRLRRTLEAVGVLHGEHNFLGRVLGH